MRGPRRTAAATYDPAIMADSPSTNASALAGFTAPAMFTRDAVRASPDAPGVHVVRDPAGDALYVGQTQQLRSRMLAHLRGERETGSILHNKVVRLLDESLG